MSIRTTVTLDEDVVAKLKHQSAALGIPFRQTLNDVLRAGFLAENTSAKPRTFQIQPRHMGTIPGIDYSNIEELLELGEGEDHR